MKCSRAMGTLLAVGFLSFNSYAQDTIPSVIYSPNCVIGISTQAPTDEDGNREMMDDAIEYINKSAKGYTAVADSKCFTYPGEVATNRRYCDLRVSFSTSSEGWSPELRFYYFQNFNLLYSMDKKAGLRSLFGSGKSWFMSNIKELPRCQIRK